MQRKAGENVICFSSKDYGADVQENLSPTLRAGGHDGSHANAGVPPAIAYAIQERAICENPLSGPDGVGVRDDDVAYTMESRTVPQAVAYMPARSLARDGEVDSRFAERDICDALHTGSGQGNKAPLITDVCVTEPVTHTLKAEGFDASEDGTGRGQPITAVEMAVRRLMPIECERLQGFPDNWTLVPTGKKQKPAADGPRYKQLGNSMATNVMHWIGGRIVRYFTQIGHNGGPPLDEFEALLG